LIRPVSDDTTEGQHIGQWLTKNCQKLKLLEMSRAYLNAHPWRAVENQSKFDFRTKKPIENRRFDWGFFAITRYCTLATRSNKPWYFLWEWWSFSYRQTGRPCYPSRQRERDRNNGQCRGLLVRFFVFRYWLSL